MPSSNNQKNQKITFLEDTAPIISEILKRYGLEKEDEDIFEKIEQGKPCLLGGVILDIVVEVAQGKILKKDLILSLEKRLNIPQEKAKKLAEDIEKKLLILAKKVPEEETEIPEKPPVPSRIKPSVPSEKPPIVEKPKTPLKEKETPKEPDVYREPIE